MGEATRRGAFLSNVDGLSRQAWLGKRGVQPLVTVQEAYHDSTVKRTPMRSMHTPTPGALVALPCSMFCNTY